MTLCWGTAGTASLIGERVSIGCLEGPAMAERRGGSMGLGGEDSARSGGLGRLRVGDVGEENISSNGISWNSSGRCPVSCKIACMLFAGANKGCSCRANILVATRGEEAEGGVD